MAGPPILCTVTLLTNERARYEDSLGRKVDDMPVGADPLSLATAMRLAEHIEDDERGSNGVDLKLLGQHLYRVLFGAPGSRADAEFKMTYKAFSDWRGHGGRGNPDLRLRLTLAFESGASALASLPWEFLYVEPPDEPGVFVAGARTELALTRCVPPTVPGGLAPAKPLRILLAVCSPVGLKQFDARQAVEDIERLAEHDRVEVRPLPNPRYSDLQRVISEEGWVPHVFHFIGHGDPDGLAIRMEEREQREHHAATGEASWEAKSINADQLSALFAEGSKPRLVFLHACEGAAPSSYASFADTARRLVGEDIPAVIAMRYSIVGEDAAAFAQRFYEQIGRGMPVDEAVTVARHHLANLPSDPKSWSNRRFGTPLLYLQSDAAVILEPPPRGEDARIRQPCPYEATKDCRASVFPEYRNCRACKGRLVWCSRDHANTPDEDQCAVCSEAIRTRQPVAPAPSPEAGSGFRVESSPWKT